MAVPTVLETALAAEIGCLTKDDDKQRAETFAAAIRRNVRNWEAFRCEDPTAWEWSVLEAYLARVDVSEHSSVVYAARLEFVRTKLDGVLARDGLAYAHAEPRRRTLLRRFYPELAENSALL